MTDAEKNNSRLKNIAQILASSHHSYLITLRLGFIFSSVTFLVSQNPCSANQCQNGGTCQTTSSTEFTCTCPSDHLGDRCEISEYLRPATSLLSCKRKTLLIFCNEALRSIGNFWKRNVISNGAIMTCRLSCWSRGTNLPVSIFHRGSRNQLMLKWNFWYNQSVTVKEYYWGLTSSILCRNNLFSGRY